MVYRRRGRRLLALVIIFTLTIGNAVFASEDNSLPLVESFTEDDTDEIEGLDSDEHDFEEIESNFDEMINEEDEEFLEEEQDFPEIDSLFYFADGVLGSVEDIDLDSVSSGPGYTYSSNCITINDGGTYSLSDSGTNTGIRIAVESTDPVTLILNDITISSVTNNAPISIADGADATILIPDGTVNTMTSQGIYAGIYVSENAVLTIDIPMGDSGTGELRATATNGAAIGAQSSRDNGTVIIKGGQITAAGTRGAGIGGSGWTNASNLGGGSGGTITITGGKVTASSGQGAAIGGGDGFNTNGGEGGNITIGGDAVVFASTNGPGSSSAGAAIGGGGSPSSNFVSGSGGMIIIEGNANVTATATGSSTAGAGIGGGGAYGTSNTNGGESGTIIIRGDAVVNASSTYSAGIGGGGNGSHSTATTKAGSGTDITIEGNVQVTASSTYGAGIGGGGYGHQGGDGGNITINTTSAGLVTADSSWGAGIGGGGTVGTVIDSSGGDGGTILIKGDSIVDAKSVHSAGIGGGGSNPVSGAVNQMYGGNGGNITISDNAHVTAESENGTGIGGGRSYRGQGGDGGNITITGGTVIATGGSDKSEANSVGAGIGGGGKHNVGSNTNGGDGGTILITGGTVTAVGYRGAGIGGGGGSTNETKGGSGGDITISGGAVLASSVYGAGIGGGEGRAGYGGDGGTITIKGSAEVTAIGGEYSSGIGGARGAANYTGVTSEDTSHISSISFGEGAELSIEATADVSAYSRYGYALHTKDDSISGGAHVVNLYVWQASDKMDVVHGTSAVSIKGNSRDKLHIANVSVPAAFTSFAFIGNSGPYVLVTDETTPRGIIYHADSSPQILSSNTDGSAKKITFGQPTAYTVTYNGGGGTGPVPTDSKIYTLFEDAIILDDVGLEKDGFEFDGWKDNSAGTGLTYVAGDTYEMTANVTFYAQWKALPTYNVTYNANGGTGTLPIDSNNYIAGTEATVLDNIDLVKDGFEFDGWRDNDQNTGTIYYAGDKYPISGAVTFYANWKAVSPVQNYSVTYNANGGTGTVPVDSNSYTAGDEATILDNINLTRNSYSFEGWTVSAGTGTIYKAGDKIVINGDVTLYAYWKSTSTEGPGSGGGGGGGTIVNKDKHKVTFLMNDSTDEVYLERTVDDGSIISKPSNPSREGYEFTGWYTESSCVTLYDFSQKVYESFSLYAGWEPVEFQLFTEEHFAYIAGYPDGSVRPENNITRSEVAAILYRLLDEDYRASVYSTNSIFSDVSIDAWYGESIATMTNAGVLDGYPDGLFKPGNNITRGEFAKVVAMFLGGEYAGGNKFNDIDGHWAAQFINLASEKGWIEGYPGGTYRPDSFITRAEAVAIINRILERNPETIDDLLEDMIVWPDNSDTAKWYYIDIHEASNSHTYERKESGYERWVELY